MPSRPEELACSAYITALYEMRFHIRKDDESIGGMESASRFHRSNVQANVAMCHKRYSARAIGRDLPAWPSG